MDQPRDPKRLELLEADIDIRLQPLWDDLADMNQWNLGAVLAFMRAAYGKGYIDALREDMAGERGRLCRDFGYRFPQKT